MFVNDACSHIHQSSKLEISGIQNFPIVVYNKMEHNQYGITVFGQFVSITLPTYKATPLVISEIRHLANILEPVKISRINTLL